MSRPLGVGIIGATSTVARLAVMPAIEASGTCRIAATASLSDPSATHGSYEALLGDPAVEAVYIALPNSLHRRWTELAAAAGKHVLCEKPLAPSAGDAEAMAAACAGAGVVLMEAYMTWFHPRDRAARDLVESGSLGEPLFARTRFTGVLDRPDDHRWRPEMGGGALLDVGIYCLTPLLVAGGAAAGAADRAAGPGGVAKACRVQAAARWAPLGVDASFSGWLDFGGGRSGAFECSFEAPEIQLLEVVGTDIALRVERCFTPGPSDSTLRLVRRDGTVEEHQTGSGDPYRLMCEHFAAVVRGEVACERPPSDSVALQHMVDRLARAAREAPDVRR